MRNPLHGVESPACWRALGRSPPASNPLHGVERSNAVNSVFRGLTRIRYMELKDSRITRASNPPKHESGIRYMELKGNRKGLQPTAPPHTRIRYMELKAPATGLEPVTRASGIRYMELKVVGEAEPVEGSDESVTWS